MIWYMIGESNKYDTLMCIFVLGVVHIYRVIMDHRFWIWIRVDHKANLNVKVKFCTFHNANCVIQKVSR